MTEIKPTNECTINNATMNNIIHSGETTECLNPDPKSLLEMAQNLKDENKTKGKKNPNSIITSDLDQTANKEKIPDPNAYKKMEIESIAEILMKKTPEDDHKSYQQATCGIGKNPIQDEGQRMIDDKMDPYSTITSRPLMTAQKSMINDKEITTINANQTGNKENITYDDKMGKDSNGVAKGGKYSVYFNEKYTKYSIGSFQYS